MRAWLRDMHDQPAAVEGLKYLPDEALLTAEVQKAALMRFCYLIWLLRRRLGGCGRPPRVTRSAARGATFWTPARAPWGLRGLRASWR